MIYPSADLEKFSSLIAQAQHILVLQPEHIDSDSLGSSLGLEQILEDQGKQVAMYCIDQMPNYLKHTPGWDRVVNELPNNFDLTILVDSSTINQLEKTFNLHKGSFGRKPFIIIDHHASETGRIDFATLKLLDPKAGACAQQIVELSQHFEWKLDPDSAYALAAGIKGDTVNLSTESTTARTLRAMAHLVECGVNLEQLRHNIEQTQAIPAEQVKLRALALGRTEFFHQDKIAISYYTEAEYTSLGDDKLVIEKTKHDLRVVQGVALSVTITERKGYSNASMRANLPVARAVAEHFGGGGHDRAASCRFMNARHEAVIEQLVPVLTKEIDEYEAANPST